MTADDMLREASDPTTPVERLRVLYAKATGHHYDAVVRNPSLPLDLLRWELLAGSTMAWFNPATEALLRLDMMDGLKIEVSGPLGEKLTKNELLIRVSREARTGN